MSLAVLVVIVAVGIAAVVAAVHLTGGSAPARLAGEDAAVERFGRDFPDAAVRSVLLTRDADAAFLALADGRVGLVRVFGGKFLTRIVGAGDLDGTPHANGARLALRLRDFTSPGGVFTFAQAGQAGAAADLFAALLARDAGERT